MPFSRCTSCMNVNSEDVKSAKEKAAGVGVTPPQTPQETTSTPPVSAALATTSTPTVSGQLSTTSTSPAPGRGNGGAVSDTRSMEVMIRSRFRTYCLERPLYHCFGVAVQGYLSLAAVLGAVVLPAIKSICVHCFLMACRNVRTRFLPSTASLQCCHRPR